MDLRTGENALVAFLVECNDAGNDVAQGPLEGAGVGAKPAANRAGDAGEKLDPDQTLLLRRGSNRIERCTAAAHEFCPRSPILRCPSPDLGQLPAEREHDPAQALIGHQDV
jgi:hypothetical protein